MRHSVRTRREMMRHLGTIDLDLGDNRVVLASLYERNLPSSQLGLEKQVKK